MIPKVKVENLSISKAVIGTNPFLGILHRNHPWETYRQLRRFKEVEAIAKCITHLVQTHGLNAVVSSPREKIYDAIKQSEKETGEKIHWLCTPSMRRTVKGLEGDLLVQIQWCADHDVSVCMPHRVYTDLAMDYENKVIGGIDYDGSTPVRFKGRMLPVYGIKKMCENAYVDVAAKIRDLGMIPGLSTHFIESIKICDERNYDTGLIIQPLNKLGYQSNTEPEKLIEIIQNTKRQILNIKPCAAGRLSQKEGYEFSLSNIKENDIMAFGFDEFDQCVEDGKILEEILGK